MMSGDIMNDDFSPAYRSPQTDSEIVNHIRAQRHDFMNEIQVIWGYLQIDKPEEARKYIAGLNRYMNLYSRIFHLGNPTLSLFLYDHVCKAEKMGLAVDFSCDLVRVDDKAFTLNYHEKLNLLDCLFKKVVEGNSGEGSTIYIDIYSENNEIYIVFANNPDVTDMDFSEGSYAGIAREVKDIADPARKSGIKSMCSIDGTNITAAICFAYKEGN